MSQCYATIAVSVNNIGKLSVSDYMSLTLHDTEEEARDAVQNNLRAGDKAVALLSIEGVYRAKSIEIEKVE
jgi:hypothetical protein